MSDGFEEFLRREARGVNEPPERVPRDEMWEGIVARRRERAVQWRRRPMVVVRWGLAAAAVLAVGMGIGRYALGPEAPETRVVALPGAGPIGALTAVPGGAGATATPSDAAYRYAAAQYLGRAEVLITLFVVEARQGRTDPGASATARELLSTNRLLQDSPASNDPQLKALLDDLELVLAQIAQLAAQRGVGERDLIVQGLRESGTMVRLRSALPASPPVRNQQRES